MEVWIQMMDVWEAGYDARVLHGDHTTHYNPYEFNTTPNNFWHRGWEAADKALKDFN